MAKLTPLEQIALPVPQPDQEYRIRILEREFQFQGLKKLLAAADYSKAGDRNAILAADSEFEREAARAILSSLTLRHLYDSPLTDDEGRIDSVMRVNYDIDLQHFQTIEHWTVGELKDWLLQASREQASGIGVALTGVMAAAVAKLMDTHELIFAARKMNRTTKARTTLGLSGTLSSRLQPNDAVDDLRSITLLVYAGLSLGSGDALIGLNPATDTIENISTILWHLNNLRRRLDVPTQICVLAHIKTQLACLENGAPVEIMFQSLAGTERTNLTEFDITVDLLDRAYETMRTRGPIKDVASQFMYFETGQGSEFTYGKHNGIDMTTAEALCYGLARRWDPFMINNVTGFIGPETHVDNTEMILSNLQDHFMGKLLGLPMGMAPCYTLHSQITLEGQQIATQLLATAGANYYMDVCLNTDRMLAYFDTSGHDNQTLRELHARSTTPEYRQWAIARGILKETDSGILERGPQWGNLSAFCESDEELHEMLRLTPAIHGFKHTGPRPSNEVTRSLRMDHAAAREAIYSELQTTWLQTIETCRVLETVAATKEDHLKSPEPGCRLTQASVLSLIPEHRDVQIVITDGLSAEAVHHNAEKLLPPLVNGLRRSNISIGLPIIVRNGRVKLAEHIAECLQPKLVVMLIGERPGGNSLASRSLSAYLAYAVAPDVLSEAARFSGNPEIRFEYTVISNIYSAGLPASEAARVITRKVLQILSHRAAGNRLESVLNPAGDLNSLYKRGPGRHE